MRFWGEFFHNHWITGVYLGHYQTPIEKFSFLNLILFRKSAGKREDISVNHYLMLSQSNFLRLLYTKYQQLVQ